MECCRLSLNEKSGSWKVSPNYPTGNERSTCYFVNFFSKSVPCWSLAALSRQPGATLSKVVPRRFFCDSVNVALVQIFWSGGKASV